LIFGKRHGALSTTRWARVTLRGILKFEKMSKPKSVERSERPLAKTVLAKLVQIGEPTRSIYAERLRELKPNAREALQLLSVWEGKRAELALTQPLSEKAAALARQAMDATVRPRRVFPTG
jgi:hypothetical protein